MVKIVGKSTYRFKMSFEVRWLLKESGSEFFLPGFRREIKNRNVEGLVRRRRCRFLPPWYVEFSVAGAPQTLQFPSQRPLALPSALSLLASWEYTTTCSSAEYNKLSKKCEFLFHKVLVDTNLFPHGSAASSTFLLQFCSAKVVFQLSVVEWLTEGGAGKTKRNSARKSWES